jgi:hypothetical protein
MHGLGRLVRGIEPIGGVFAKPRLRGGRIGGWGVAYSPVLNSGGGGARVRALLDGPAV